MNNKLNSIEALANEIIFKVTQIREEIEEKPTDPPDEKDPMYNINFEYVGDNMVKITWDSDVDKDFTFLYYFTGKNENGEPINKEWQHSSANYRKKPEKTSQLLNEIPIRLHGTWKFKAVVGEWIPEKENNEVVGGKIKKEWESEVFEVTKKADVPEEPTEPPIENEEFSRLEKLEGGSYLGFTVQNNELEIPYIKSDQGTERIAHQLKVSPSTKYTLSFDVLFKDDWTFNTEGDENNFHKDTGYPYQTGKLHGLGSQNPTKGRGEQDDDRWSTRIIWQRNTKTHKPHPDHSPINNNEQPFDHEDGVCLGVTYYGTDRESGERGVFVPSDFANIENNKWYTIQLHVNTEDDRIVLLVKGGDKVLGGLNIHAPIGNSPIETMLFNTFFGGNSKPFAPKNNLQYAKFKNFSLTQNEIEYKKPEDEKEPEEPDTPDGDWKPSFEVVVGDVKGCYNVHGIKDDESLNPPSLNQDDWELLSGTHDPIVHHSETVGERKIDPVGFYLSKSGLNLFYNSGWRNYERWFELREERGYRGATNQAGSLFAFNDDFSKKKEHPESPVLDQPQRNWQGRNRVNPYALVYHEIEKQFYCFYGDFAEGGDCDKYKGRRALGCARSKDMVNWEYLSVDKPMLDIKDVYDLDPEPFPNNNFCSQGRLYCFGATWHNNQIYLKVGGGIGGSNFETTLRSREPMDYWKPVGGGGRPMPINVKGKWYRPQNVGITGGGRGIALAVSDDVRDSGENHLIFDTGHGGSAGTSRQLFAYKGKWHVAYRQRDEEQWANDREDFRDMYIAREK